MERGKMSSTGRGGKSKGPQHPQDIFALGSKSTVPVSRDSEKRNILKPSTSGSSDRKREAATFGAQPPGKRSRIGSPAESVTGTSLEVDPVDLVPHVLQALDTHNSDKLLGLLTGSIRLLKSQRSKPDPILCMSMLYLVKIRPNMFAHDTVTQSLCSLLKREQGTGFKSKGNPLVFVLACNMLYAAHKDSRNWPETFIKVYIEDALNERWWVDCSWCKCLVENIVTAFNTKQPPAHLIPTESTLGTMSPSGAGSPLVGADEDLDNLELEYSVFPRYSSSYETVEALVLEAIKEQIQRRAAPDAIGKGFLKLLAATCGFPEIRMISASRLEAWLHSGKLWRNAQELLACVCCNCDASGPTAARDHEALAQLARMRLKTKPLQNAYVACLREMVSESPALLRSVVTHTIYNELSNVRAPNNLAVLSALVQAQPQRVPQAMADTYQELLLRPEEYIRPLRALTRECVRGGRGEAAALLPLARALAQAPPHDPPPEVRERAFAGIADLFSLCCLIIASHSKHLPEHKQHITAIQAAAVGWMLETAMPIYRPSRQDYQLALHKIMFVEPVETYSKTDNWPPESERALLYRTCCEAPLPQHTLLRLIFIGLAKEIPISPAETLELVETLVRRACALPPEENPLQVDKLEIADYIFQLSQFHPPENITLPAGYSPPPLAITALYWKGWTVLVLLCAHNAATFAQHAAQLYPTLRALIDASITNKPSIEWCNNTQAEAEAERAAILQLESHLAAASNVKLPITEHNCRLPSQLTTLDPLGPARRPPAAVLEQFQAISQQVRLGRLLCRQPALLLELVERHGTRQAMPWLHHLLHHDHLQLSVLPVQCLCEFLCSGAVAVAGSGAGSGASSGAESKAGELAAHLRRTVTESEEGALAVLHYYTQRLASSHIGTRASASRGLKLVLTQTNEDVNEMDFNAEVSPEEWLDSLWVLPHWETIKEEVVTRIRAACLIECSPRYLAAYIAFLARYVRETPDADHNDLVLDLSQVLMERLTVMGAVLPQPAPHPAPQPEPGPDLAPHRNLYNLTTIFYLHMQKIRVPTSSPLPPPPASPAPGAAAPVSSEEGSGCRWAGSERVSLRWARHEASTQLLHAHAHLKLLCLGPSYYDTQHTMYSWLTSLWTGPHAPLATSESGAEVPLLPDWLRLHLVRSARGPLLETGLRGLSAQKLALFIQTFGMPVVSMSALLSALDASPAGAVLRLGVERPYMSQLLRVQRARGATGGGAFAAALQLVPPEYPPEDTLFSAPPRPPARPGAWAAPARPGAWAAPGAAELLPIEQVDCLLSSAVATDPAWAHLYAKIQQEANDCAASPSAPTPYTSLVLRHLCPPSPASPACPPSAALCRALLPHAAGQHAAKILEITKSLLQSNRTLSTPLISVLRALRHRAAGAAAGAGAGAAGRRGGRLAYIPRPANKEQLLQVLESATPETLEEVVNCIVECQDTELVVDVVSTVLDKNIAGDYEDKIKPEPGTPIPPAHVFSRRGLGCGLLLDCLSELQPDTLGKQPHRQMRVMFNPCERSSGAAWSAQLVTLVLHRASWRTLHTCLRTLLDHRLGWDARSVLEFAEALVRSPRVWQGRDKTTPKHHTPEDLLRLKHQQLCVLVKYILEEAEKASLTGGSDATRRSIERRLALLLQCCSTPAALLCAAAPLLDTSSAVRVSTPAGKEGDIVPVSTPAGQAADMLMLLLYMKVPKILKLLSESGSRWSGPVSLGRAGAGAGAGAGAARDSTSAVDTVSHTLLCAIADTNAHNTQNNHKIQRLEAGVRALWARSGWGPWAGAGGGTGGAGGAGGRALSLAAALLRGAHARSPHLTYLLSALEMVPDEALFSDHNSKELGDILECLMNYAATTHGGGGGGAGGGGGGGLVHRVAAILRRYLASKPARAAAAIHAYRPVVASVPALSGLTLAGGEAAPASAQPPPLALAVLQRRRDTHEELHASLQEIEAWGTRRGGAWGGLVTSRLLLQAAAPLLTDSHQAVRGAAVSLLVKLLPACDDTTPALQAILECLDSSQSELAQSVLERLSDLLPGMLCHAHRILMKVFELGIRSRLPADQTLAKCVATINLLRGC